MWWTELTIRMEIEFIHVIASSLVDALIALIFNVVRKLIFQPIRTYMF